MSNLLQLIKKS